jgi:hypothetical protein
MEDYFNCGYCKELVSDEPLPYEPTCNICQKEIDADDQQGEQQC